MTRPQLSANVVAAFLATLGLVFGLVSVVSPAWGAHSLQCGPGFVDQVSVRNCDAVWPGLKTRLATFQRVRGRL